MSHILDDLSNEELKKIIDLLICPEIIRSMLLGVSTDDFLVYCKFGLWDIKIDIDIDTSLKEAKDMILKRIKEIMDIYKNMNDCRLN